jgi:glycyl-tRNA synthetase
MGYDEVMRLALQRGFFQPSCEIYAGAPAGFWEYGPLGLALRNRYVELWRRELVRRDGMVEIDGSQIMARAVFEASGHLESFADPIMKCSNPNCGLIVRADRFVEEQTGVKVPERLADEELASLIREKGVRCPRCRSEFGAVRRFNMMFRVGIGPEGGEAYLRPETCQSIFVDFPRLYRVMRLKLPVGVAQVGKSFRNEISPRQGLLRLREFYQAEIEVFFNPNRPGVEDRFKAVQEEEIYLVMDNGEEYRGPVKGALTRGLIPSPLIAYYLALLNQFYRKTGIDPERSRFRELGPEEKAFYAESAFDFEVETSVGWLELVACNYRTDYDLKRHAEVSRQNLEVLDGDEKVLPHIFELSMGIDRSLYALLEHSLVEEAGRRVLKVPAYLAPIQVGIFPLVSRDGLPEVAQEVHRHLAKELYTYYDDSGSIGRRYRRADEVGVPLCVTVDYDTLKDRTVTVRDRDTMEQVRVAIDELPAYIHRWLSYPS